MPLLPRALLLPSSGSLLLLALLTAAPASAATPPLPPSERPAAAAPAIDEGYLWIRDLLSDQRKLRREAARRLIERGDRGLVFGIVDALFFIAKPFRGEALDTLEQLTGEKPGRSYWDWVELVGRFDQVAPSPGYNHWKASLFAHLDEGYRRLLDPAAARTLRLEEVVSGGVKIEGIPALDDPAMVAAADAAYLDPDEEVFAVYWQGEARAYPRRFLDWHEMLNDQVGGEPITLSYCTLCGAGVLFATARPGRPPFRFATSGLLYRSNKLMFDRATGTLWSNLTGEPVLGPLVAEGVVLPLLPLTRTTWGDWRRRHPSTLVMALDRRLRQVALEHGFDYRPGKADLARRGVSFPVGRQSSALPAKEEIYALRLGSAAKAYALDRLLDQGLLNDQLADQPIVLWADRASGAVRVYRRPSAEPLRPGPQADQLLDASGHSWRVGELGLEPEGDSAGRPSCPRLPGHLAYFFGWYAFFPHTEVWPGPETGRSAPATASPAPGPGGGGL